MILIKKDIRQFERLLRRNKNKFVHNMPVSGGQLGEDREAATKRNRKAAPILAVYFMLCS